MMLYNFLDISKPLEFNSLGKFESPSPDWMHPKTPLSNLELIVMTKGTLYLKMGEEKHAVSEGQYLLLQPQDNVFRKGYRPSKCEYYWMHFSCRNHFFKENPSPNDFIATDHTMYLPTQADLIAPEKVLLFMRLLQDHRRSAYLSSLDYGNYLTTLVLCEIYQQYSHQLKSGTGRTAMFGSPQQKSSTQLYNDLVDYIHFNLNKNLKIQDMAEHFGYSAKHLSLVCKQHGGYPLKHMILKAKIESAQFQLLDTNASVQEISASLGFPDSHNFSRTFKSITGMTPSECRTLYGKRIVN